MELLKRVLVMVTILRQTHEIFLRPEVKPDRFEKMTEQVGKLLSDCTRLQVNNVAVVSDSEATIKWTPKSLERISLLNLKVSELSGLLPWNMTWQEKFHTFLLITSSGDNLEYLISRLKNTTLWNPSALYVLFDNNIVERGYQSVESFLQVAWRYNLLSSTLVCVDPVKGVMAYTFNPYSTLAPETWERLAFTTQLQSIFERKVIPGVTTCRDITFDKTTVISDYPVVWILSGNPNLSNQVPDEEHNVVDLIEMKTFRLLQEKWNKVGDLFVYPNLEDNFEQVNQFARNRYVVLKSIFIHDTQHMTTTYPHRSIGFAILSRFPGYASPYEKILRYMNPMFIAAILLISLATGIVLGKCTGQGATSGSLEVLRIMLGGSMLRFPKTKPLRIHMITILLLFMLSTYTFHGNLSSLLTTPAMNPLIDSMEDLKQSGYPIYLFHGHRNMITDDILYSRIRLSDSWNCSGFVENLEGVACLAERGQLLRTAYEKQLYLSTNSINNMYAAFVVPPDWPLTEAMSRILLMMNDGGLMNFMSDTVERESKYNTKWQRMQADTTSTDYQNLNLSNVSFAFYILLFGHVVSVVIFIGEVLIYRFRKLRARKENERLVILPFVQ